VAERPVSFERQIGEVGSVVAAPDRECDAVPIVPPEVGDHVGEHPDRGCGGRRVCSVTDLHEHGGQLELGSVMGRLERRRQPRRISSFRQSAERVGHPEGIGRDENARSSPDLRCVTKVPEGVDREARDVALAAVDRREDEGRPECSKMGREASVQPLVMDMEAGPTQEQSRFGEDPDRRTVDVVSGGWRGSPGERDRVGDRILLRDDHEVGRSSDRSLRHCFQYPHDLEPSTAHGCLKVTRRIEAVPVD